MFCRNCGNELKEGEQFCSKCGFNLKEDGKQVKDNKKIISIKFNHLVICIIIVLLIILGLMLLIINSKKSNSNTILKSENITELNVTDNHSTGTDFISEIKSKYPSESENICTDGDNYWLLSSRGDKLYFNDLESFELVLEANMNIDYDDNSDQHSVEMIDKKIFINNLTDEDKSILGNYIKTTPREAKRYVGSFNEETLNKSILEYGKKFTKLPLDENDDLIEEKFIVKNNEIVYILIYVRGSSLNQKMFIITPAKSVPKYIADVYNLEDYFVINENPYQLSNIDFGKSYGITDEDIEKAKNELKVKIDTDLEKLVQKKKEFFEEKNIPDSINSTDRINYEGVYKEPREEIARDYLRNCSELKSDRDGLSTDVFCSTLYPPDEGKDKTLSWRKSGYYCGYSYYCQIINNNKVLYVSTYYNTTRPNSYKEECTTEYFGAGVCIDITDIPLLYEDFSSKQLILTGYLPEYSKENFVMTPITEKIGEKNNLTDEEQQKIIINQNNYIRSHFGL